VLSFFFFFCVKGSFGPKDITGWIPLTLPYDVQNVTMNVIACWSKNSIHNFHALRRKGSIHLLFIMSPFFSINYTISTRRQTNRAIGTRCLREENRLRKFKCSSAFVWHVVVICVCDAHTYTCRRIPSLLRNTGASARNATLRAPG